MKNDTSAVRFIFNRREAQKLIPPVSSRDNKASRGRCLILAGSDKYPGAGVLAAQAALRSGSGYVVLAHKDVHFSMENPDFLFADLRTTSWTDWPHDAILIGPGFGINDFTAKVISELKERGEKKVVLDADALTVCAREKLFPLPPSWIVTPHSGELARCLGLSVAEIDQDRWAATARAQKVFGCIVLLKGHGTLVAGPQGTHQITSGNAALAKAGTGDVLAGVITALRAQGLSALDSALLGAYIHGATANLWRAHKKDLLAMRAIDVIEALPRVIFKIREET